jgi:hypothetical protein
LVISYYITTRKDSRGSVGHGKNFLAIGFDLMALKKKSLAEMQGFTFKLLLN